MLTPHPAARSNAVGRNNDEISREARLDEQREQRRNVITTFIVAGVVTGIVGLVALTRVNTEANATRITVDAAHETSYTSPSTLAPTSTSATTTTVRHAPPTTTKTTVAPPLTIPTGLGGLIATTTTTAPRLATTTTTQVAPPPTNPPPPRVAHIQWSASPSSPTVAGGGIYIVTVTARNVGNAAGNASGPHISAVTLAPNSSTPWTVTLRATTDGTSNGSTLSVGLHYVTIGGAVIILHVT